jgi:hypothetical protein
MRGQFTESEVDGTEVDLSNIDNDLQFAYRLRLKAAADLGSGYFFKAMLSTDNNAGGWNTVANNNEEASDIDISQLYFGRMQENCHWMVGRLPLNSVNNPIFDLALYPFSPADTAVATFNMDRVYGLNYGTKLGSGEANVTLVILDNNSQDDSNAEGDGFFNDGHALHLSYKDKIGDVTIEPQAIISLTNLNGGEYGKVSPNTFGMNLSIPAGDAKIGLSGFYTVCNDNGLKTVDDGNPATDDTFNTEADVDYSGYLLRLKGEVGNFMAWIDYNQTNDKTDGIDDDYDNLFVWAQYNFKVYDSAAGSFSLTPIVRYWAAGYDDNNSYEGDYSRLRTELVATVTF